MAHNEVSKASEQINFQRLVLSNPLVDVETERMHQHELGFAIGLYDESQSAQVEVLRRHCEETITDASVDVSTAENNCKDILNYISKLTGTVNQMDSRYFSSDNYPNDAFQDMFKYSDQVASIKDALHITKPNSFSKTNSTVAGAITTRNENTAGVFTSLLAKGIQILINIGQFDMKDGVLQTLEWTKQIEFGSRGSFDEQARSLYMFTDSDSVDKVGGYYRHSDNFTLVVTPKAGHMVAASQVVASKNYVSDLLTYGELRCLDG